MKTTGLGDVAIVKGKEKSKTMAVTRAKNCQLVVRKLEQGIGKGEANILITGMEGTWDAS